MPGLDLLQQSGRCFPNVLLTFPKCKFCTTSTNVQLAPCKSWNGSSSILVLFHKHSIYSPNVLYTCQNLSIRIPQTSGLKFSWNSPNVPQTFPNCAFNVFCAFVKNHPLSIVLKHEDPKPMSAPPVFLGYSANVPEMFLICSSVFVYSPQTIRTL